VVPGIDQWQEQRHLRNWLVVEEVVVEDTNLEQWAERLVVVEEELPIR
jgi:hypothetical protein